MNASKSITWNNLLTGILQSILLVGKKENFLKPKVGEIEGYTKSYSPVSHFKKLSFKKSFRFGDLDLALHLRSNNPIQNLYLHVDPHFVPMTLYQFYRKHGDVPTI